MLIAYQDLEPLRPGPVQGNPSGQVHKSQLPHGDFNYASYLDYHDGPAFWEWTDHGWVGTIGKDTKPGFFYHRPSFPAEYHRRKVKTQVYIVVPQRDLSISVSPTPPLPEDMKAFLSLMIRAGLLRVEEFGEFFTYP